MRNKVVWIFASVFIAVLLIQVVVAAFTFDITALNDTVYTDEQATFRVTITNYGDAQERLLVFSNDPRFLAEVEPKEVRIPAGQSQEVVVSISPKGNNVVPGAYGVPVVFKGVLNGETIEKSFSIIIRSSDQRVFSASLVVDAQINDDNDVDPRTQYPIEFRFVNKNRLNIHNLTVSYETAGCEGSFASQIPPNGELLKEVACSIDTTTPPGEQLLRVQVYANGEQVGALKTFEYAVREVNELAVSKNTQSEFLLKTLQMEITNDGNLRQQQTFLVQRNFLEKPFSTLSASRNTQIQETSGGYNFIVDLAPGESASFSVQTNTRGAFATILGIIIVLAVLTILYYTLRSPLVIKRTITVLSERDGGSNSAKVVLNIRNRTSKGVEKIQVVQSVPTIVDIDRAFDVGTLKPTKIVRHEHKGTLVRWDFTSLEPFEERIITFRIATKLGIVGKVHLPPTRVKFSTDGGKTFRTVRFEQSPE